ncbi:MAG TPA: glycoside hydrolase family 20 zincin-like fold domain-containing protein [Bacillota bacterium]|nr:glycoside hydrolase family 20 zincin-like fold domain-containing protein [Bacillota bacterium]
MPRYPKLTPPLIPAPRTVIWHRPDAQLPSPFYLLLPEEQLTALWPLSNAFQQEISREIGIEVMITTRLPLNAGFWAAVDCSAVRLRHEQGYRLEIDEKQIRIGAKNAIGAAYGLQTLKQIILFSGRTLPTCYITDWPDSTERSIAFHFTNGRTQTLQNLSAWVDRMAALKYNRLDLFFLQNKEDENIPQQFSEEELYQLTLYAAGQFIKVIAHQQDTMQDVMASDHLAYGNCFLENTVSGATDLAIQALSETAEQNLTAASEGILVDLQPAKGWPACEAVCYYPFVFAAGIFWCWESNLENDIFPWLDAVLLQERSGSAGKLLRDLGNCYQGLQSRDARKLSIWPGDLLSENFEAYLETLGQLDPVSLDDFIAKVQTEHAQLSYLEMRVTNGVQTLAELENTCRLLLLAAELARLKLLLLQGIQPDAMLCAKLAKEYRGERIRWNMLWYRRHKPASDITMQESYQWQVSNLLLKLTEQKQL